MNDDIFYKVTNPREKAIVYEPRSGLEMEKAMLHRTPIYKYSELCRMCKGKNPVFMLSKMFQKAKDAIILLQDPSNMDSGHWISVSRNLPKKEIYFFSTYGGKPDAEKVKWINEDDLIESGQFLNIFNDGLKDLQKHGWEIHYNDYPYQKSKDKTAYCGIYTVAFLRSGKNPDEFRDETLKIAKSGRNPAIVYFDKYFR